MDVGIVTRSFPDMSSDEAVSFIKMPVLDL